MHVLSKLTMVEKPRLILIVTKLGIEEQ